ncbi:DnaJ family domain-containing protein [Sporosarcina siberiensis]|uniref:DnaJ family domain-containing protein n=1 Tax=Sporosarcina siberiensis TaxID=1365606 RepID=A0ABW4SCM8_9BACL
MENSNPPYNDLMGDILKKHAKDGGMENLKGQGKPIPKEYFSGDTFQHFQKIAKEAGYKPHWLKLQHEIRDEVIVLSEIQKLNIVAVSESQIVQVNQKIAEYNKSCPPPLQKGTITVESIENAVSRWK